MWAVGLFVLIIGFVLAYGAIIFGLAGIKNAEEIARDTASPVWGLRIAGGLFMCVGVAIVILVFTILNVLLEFTAEDWKIVKFVLFGMVVLFGIFVGYGMTQGLTVKESLGVVLRFDSESRHKDKISQETRRKLGIGTIIAFLVLAVVFVIIAIKDPMMAKESKSNVTCGVCDRTFKEGSDNARSIARSNMCENCHDNFEWRQEVQDYIDNMPIDD